MARRARGEGSLYLRKDGVWAAVVSRNIGGKPVRFYKYGASKKEALEKLKEIREALKVGVSPSQKTLEQFVDDDWLPAKLQVIRRNTAVIYERKLRKFILPYLGQHKLTDIHPLHIEGWLRDLKKLELPSLEVRDSFALLNSIFRGAVRRRVLAANPLESVDRPVHKERVMTVWSVEEANRFLEATRGEEIGRIATLALADGLRKGEILGLKVTDVDLKNRKLTIERQLLELKVIGEAEQKTVREYGPPKTDSSTRTITLSKASAEAIRQQLEYRMRIGQAGAETLFVTQGGAPQWRQFIDRKFFKAIAKAGVPKIRFHDMRHTNVTIMLDDGANPKAVAARVGHKNPAMTLRIYAKFTKKGDEVAAAIVDSAFGV